MNKQKNTKFWSLEDLKKSFEKTSEEYKGNNKVKISEIFETNICFSYRVFLNKECISFCHFQKLIKCRSLKILEICKGWGMSNPNNIKHWMNDIDKEINRQVKFETQQREKARTKLK